LGSLILNCREKRGWYRILLGKFERRGHLYVRIILKWILKKWEGLEWIRVSDDKENRRALVNTVIKFIFS
jgi:hypothetical protein